MSRRSEVRVLNVSAWPARLAAVVFAPLDVLLRRPKGQLASLDVLRTCAVMMVVWGHTVVSYHKAGGGHGALSGFRLLGSGWIGVNLFFVLSGYLIGKQLWREWGRDGTIDFYAFFLRRGLRIWPLYFFFLAFVALALGHGDFFGGKGWSDAVFLTNYLDQGVVVGSWSLCTEEQFYLLAPLAIIASAGYVRSLARFRRFLWLGLLALPAVRTLMWWRLTGNLSRHDPELWKQWIYQPIHSNCDGLLMGLIISNLVCERQASSAPYSRRLAWILFALACLAAVSLRAVQREIFNLSGMTLLLGSLVWIGLHAESTLPRVLASPVFYIGSRLSYGIYLNHAYLHEPLSRFALAYLPGAEGAPSLHLFATQCLVAVLSACFAAVTFCLIEHPFLRWRDAILKRAAAKRESREEQPMLTAEQTAPLIRSTNPIGSGVADNGA